jgi:hypothetical protein
MVCRIDNSELETPRVLQVQVQLAVLGLVNGGESWTDICLEAIETESDDL